MHTTVSFRTLIKVSFIAVGVFCAFVYIVFQARFLIIGPQIVLTEDPELLQNERKVILVGDTYNISRLWLNDRQIYTNAEGKFKEALVLENGYTVATLRAEDRYGRETTVTQSFVYAPISFNK